jgi:hypothetical protein
LQSRNVAFQDATSYSRIQMNQYREVKVTDKFFNRLKKHFADEELVELAAVIALENFLSKFNPVFGIEANNFCPLPGVKEADAAATRRFHE